MPVKTILPLAAIGLSLALGSSYASAADLFTCPKIGGDLRVGLEAAVPTLDQQTATSSETRNVAMNIFETLITRDDNMNPIPDLAKSIQTSDDGLTYTFKIRQGVKFQNGKPLTSADVMASFDRYKRVGADRTILQGIKDWETPDPDTFVIHLTRPQPTFLENISSYSTPIVIMPSEEANKPANQIDVIGTGPFKLDKFVPDSYVRLVKYDGYKPNDSLPGLTGFAGHKQACVNSVTFRMLTEPDARMAALETGEVDIVEDVPTRAQKRLAAEKGIQLTKLKNFALNVGYPNWSAPPTDNLKVRQAMMAALNMKDIMIAATDGAYALDPAFQYPGQNYYSTAGKQYYNQNDPAKAKELLKEAGYKGQPIVLLTNQQYPSMYNTALVMAQQLKAAGMNAQVKVLDWPTALAMSEDQTKGWNFFYTYWATVTAQGGPASLRDLAEPSNVYKPKGGKGDPEFNSAYEQIVLGKTIADRKAAFAKAQEIALRKVMAIPFGIMSQAQATRSYVKNYKPFYDTRVSNVWLDK